MLNAQRQYSVYLAFGVQRFAFSLFKVFIQIQLPIHKLVFS
jgi:hypothetical protein